MEHLDVKTYIRYARAYSEIRANKHRVRNQLERLRFRWFVNVVLKDKEVWQQSFVKQFVGEPFEIPNFDDSNRSFIAGTRNDILLVYEDKKRWKSFNIGVFRYPKHIFTGPRGSVGMTLCSVRCGCRTPFDGGESSICRLQYLKRASHNFLRWHSAKRIQRWYQSRMLRRYFSQVVMGELACLENAVDYMAAKERFYASAMGQ